MNAPRWLTTISMSALIMAASSARAMAEEVQPLSFKLLATAKAPDTGPAVFPEDLKKLEGKHVRLTGFIAPYSDPDNMTKFMLTEAAVGCFFCNPPQENGVVFVRLPAKAKPLNWENDTVTVEGVLHLRGHNKKDEEAEGFLFTVDDAKVVARK